MAKYVGGHINSLGMISSFRAEPPLVRFAHYNVTRIIMPTRQMLCELTSLHTIWIPLGVSPCPEKSDPTPGGHKDKLAEFSAQELSIFGSVARDQAGAESDIDILVEYTPGTRVGLLALIRLQRFLTELLGTKVDLVTPAALRPGMRDHILREAIRAA